MTLKRAFPWAVLAAGALAVLGAFMPPKHASPDVEAFGALPALQGGRVKPLDTIARTSLLLIRGKQTLPVAGRTLSATEWLLDVLARPEKADTYAVFVVDDPDILGLFSVELDGRKYFSFEDLRPYLDDIQKQSEQAEKVDSQARTRFQNAVVNLQERLLTYQRLKNTLQIAGTADLSAEIEEYRKAIPAGIKAVAAHQSAGHGAVDKKALEALNFYFERYQFLSGASYFSPIPPAAGEKDEAWATLGDSLLGALRGQDVSPVVASYARMAAAWKNGAASDFDATVAAYTQALKAAAPRAQSRSAQELVFNRVEPFYLGMVLYVCVFLLAVASWLAWPEVLGLAAYRLLLLALAVHTAGLFARIVLQGRPPVTNLYSSAVFVGWAAALLGAVVERLSRKGLGSAVASALGFGTLLIAHHLSTSGDTMEMMRAVLDSNFWLGTHVVTITIGYSSTFLAGALAHVYILRGLLTPSLDKETSKTLNTMTYGVICFALLFSFVGTVLGGIWADQSWGRFWGWDPKENGALLIVLWNAIILHARWGGYIRERGLMVMAVFGNIVTALSWFGVNMLGIGLHSYGFMDKAFYWLAAFVAFQLAVMALGSLPPKYWKSLRFQPA